MKKQDWLESFKAKRVVLYKHEKGAKHADVDFIEYENVYVLPSPDTITVLKDDELTIFPLERLYEMTFSGPAKDFFLETGRVAMVDLQKQLEDIRRLQQSQ